MNDLHSMSGAYAVDALDDLERARFERHLADCPECTAEVASLTEAAGMLALSVDAAPSADLRNRVLGEIATVRPLPPTAPAQEVVARTARRFPRLVAAAAAAAVLATGVSVWHPWQDDPPAQVAVTSQVMDAPDSRQQSVDVPGGGTATLVHSRTVGKAVLITKDMPAAPANKVYELWLLDAQGVMVPAGLMRGGTAHQTVVLKGNAREATGMGITMEPAGGSESPTTPPVALFDFKRSV
jgi:anti-sigma-K factor RskA